MQHKAARSARAVLFALVLAVGGASPALAVETSSTTAEDFQVLATISMTGVPASISYGSLNAGDTASSALLAITVSTSNPSGARLEVAASDIAGPTAIPASARTFADVASSDPGTLGGGAYTTAGSRMVIYNRTASWPSPITVNVRSRIAIPSNATPGAYTGSMTFYAVTN